MGENDKRPTFREIYGRALRASPAQPAEEPEQPATESTESGAESAELPTGEASRPANKSASDSRRDPQGRFLKRP